jgi:hypothetical protein
VKELYYNYEQVPPPYALREVLAVGGNEVAMQMQREQEGEREDSVGGRELNY